MSEEPLSPSSDKGHWDKLAESLGIKPSAEVEESSRGVALKQPEHSEMREETQSVEASSTSSHEDQTRADGSASVPGGIPVRRGWSRESRSTGNWDEIARQLGLVPSGPSTGSTPDSPETAPASPLSEAPSGMAPAGESTVPHMAATDTGAILPRVEQTVEPPVFEDAMSVTVASPEEPADIVQEEVALSGDWLEEQVVGPVETPERSAEIWPLTHDVLDVKDSRQAIAADTLFLPEVTSSPPSDQQEGEAELRTAEKKSRKRHRRKRKSRGATPINPEPFEEELPEIVELASAGEDNGTLSPSLVTDKDNREQQQEISGASGKEPKHRHHAKPDTTQATDEVEEPPQGDEDSDLVRPAHKAIPGWSEVVGYVIQKNLESRSRRPNHRDRRR